ncbi:aromatic acid exporter family protein [Macrococcoides caseolyticum]|uniref:aromatic acid exporter family protein n=1 Tax=Macrococcoides caseolyticum TaxID=69966 RepID=UPI001F1E1E7E|nr:aromatic acid exporter family protein [Macrococcus caseolyticus]MCE4957111.1 aromatic acid exporter family protein [Macrococcus caseolyticus]
MKIKPYKIGFRTIKTAFGMALGVFICKLMGLENFTSAAILVVLCVKNTKVKSLEAASARFFSCLLGILFSYIFFMHLGFNPLVLGVLVLLFIPVTVMFGIQEGVVTSIVIIMHCFNSGHIDWSLAINEFLLLCVGMGIALILNMFMPNHTKELKAYKRTIEMEFQLIVRRLSDALKHPEIILNTNDIEKLHVTIERAKSLAYMEVENHFARNDNSYYHYFDMRESQLELLSRMTHLINEISCKDKLHMKCSGLLEDLSNNITSNNFTALRLHDLYEIMLDLETYPLPDSQERLKSRSAAIQLLKEIETYLMIKHKFGSLKMY